MYLPLNSPWTQPGTPPPSSQTKGTTVGENEIFRLENLIRHFWYTNFWVPAPAPPPPSPAFPPFKHPFGTGRVCAAVQQSKTMHRGSSGDDHMPVTWGHMRELCIRCFTAPFKHRPLRR